MQRRWLLLRWQRDGGESFLTTHFVPKGMRKRTFIRRTARQREREGLAFLGEERG